MDAKAKDRIEAGPSVQPIKNTRDAAFGLVVAVIGATFLWAALVGLAVYLLHG